jgi:hypothetical protein
VWREQSFDLSITGTFVATVYIQRCFWGDDTDTAANWKDVDSRTSPTEEIGLTGGKMYFRVGVKSGGYTSGSVTATVSR